MLNQFQNESMSKHSFVEFCHLGLRFHLNFAMNHVRFMISPELNVVQEALTFDIDLFQGANLVI
jgi:hypothetical protein